ncbi:MAG: glutamate synthase [Proteobacteria bacterium]|nr:glutamate synthase [Pseudomonadota bacterium]
MSPDRNQYIDRLLESRAWVRNGPDRAPRAKAEEEGGCGVVGFACSEPVGGRHIFEPSIQMHNRGNGKGGGVAAACLQPDQIGVDEALLRDDYILQIAVLNPDSLGEIEARCITPFLRVDHREALRPAADYRELGLEVRPPDVVRYLVRVQEKVLAEFSDRYGLSGLSSREVEDEFIFQNSVRLNRDFYTSLGDQQAFVLSHARNLVIFKIVGYAEQVVQYYGLNDLRARLWIAHQRYPTKGRVWHPAGAHPFSGMNEALVHNGDFANYYSVTEYLRQHDIVPQFLTDTEVSVLLFDLWRRVYRYPLEYVIEALAPTTERDFDQLPASRQHIYRAIQTHHMSGSPDGPWFFILACSDPDQSRYQLIGITDTAMLRPQVFALQDGDVSIGLVASEKQAIDATLRSLSREDDRFRRVADRYWNARGGSHTDGGAFSFTVVRENDGRFVLTCEDKFGAPVKAPAGEYRLDPEEAAGPPEQGEALVEHVSRDLAAGRIEDGFRRLAEAMGSWTLAQFGRMAESVVSAAREGGSGIEAALSLLTLMNDRRYDTGRCRRGAVLQIVRGLIVRVLDGVPPISNTRPGRFKRIGRDSRAELRGPGEGELTLVIHGRGFPPEGEDCDSRLLVRAYQLGWKRFIVYGLNGQRFHGCGLGSKSKGVRIDVYGSSGDYLASGIDGLEIHVHDNGQDQLAQIMKSGRLVVHGDVGQTFMYGAKGGEVYVLGNAAGRPLINAVGRPRVVINGTCLDYLAESFMAGDPLRGGGFVVLNGIEFDDAGRVREQQTPYPGGNLFSLASGGAIYVRDPGRKLTPDQLNGGRFEDLRDDDWRLIRPYLENNERLFGISVADDLLTVNGVRRNPVEVYRKVGVVPLSVLARQAVPE